MLEYQLYHAISSFWYWQLLSDVQQVIWSVFYIVILQENIKYV